MKTVSHEGAAAPKICPCKATDKQLREAARYLNLPLHYLREIKRVHRKLKIHEWPGDDPVTGMPPERRGDA